MPSCYTVSVFEFYTGQEMMYAQLIAQSKLEGWYDYNALY